MHSSGQLFTLSNLDSLRVRIAKYASFEFSEPKALLPLNSATSLTRFSCECDEFDFDADSLSLFVNLTSLWVFPLTERICDVIIRGDVSLIEFCCRLHHKVSVPLKMIINMIESEPFQNMISFTFFSAEEENPFEIVNAISKTYLVYLALEMTPDWELYGLLSQMDCLNSIGACLWVRR